MRTAVALHSASRSRPGARPSSWALARDERGHLAALGQRQHHAHQRIARADAVQPRHRARQVVAHAGARRGQGLGGRVVDARQHVVPRGVHLLGRPQQARAGRREPRAAPAAPPTLLSTSGSPARLVRCESPARPPCS
jgi:hypothetical protein